VICSFLQTLLDEAILLPTIDIPTCVIFRFQSILTSRYEIAMRIHTLSFVVLLAAITPAYSVSLKASDDTSLIARGKTGNSNLELSLYTGSECQPADNTGDRGSHNISNMVYGHNYAYQTRSFYLPRALNPNEVLDFSNWDGDESSSTLDLDKTGKSEACNVRLYSVSLGDIGERIEGCHTVASPWLYFGCVSIHTQ
jgi:hypothetical protein